MGDIGSQRRGREWHRLHWPDGTHRTTAASTVGSDIDWFEEHIKDHLDQHEMQAKAWQESQRQIAGLPAGHILYTRIVKTSPLDGPAHVIVRYPYSAVGAGLTIEWVNVEPALIGCTRSTEAGAYVLDETGIDAEETIVHRIGAFLCGDRNWFNRRSL